MKFNRTLITSFFATLILGFTIISSQVSAVATYSSVDSVSMYADGDNWVNKPPVIETPSLAFSDLISGPDTGLGDGSGSGVIVTVWGHNLGSTQGSSTIRYRDSLGAIRSGHVYYWKNADGTLPGSRANLYESHGMQEIAFSIPDSAMGAGTIEVEVNGSTSTLPFTVRAGNIYHVMPSGNDTTGDGSFGNPWLTVGKADSTAPSGSTLYVQNVLTGSELTDIAIIHDNDAANSSLAAQFAYVAYPNTRPEVIGARGFTNYNPTDGIHGLVLSKFSMFSAASDTDANDLPINTRQSETFAIAGSKDGRAVGNYVTDEHPSDTNGACPDGQSAGIVGDAPVRNKVENWKVLGNMIEDFGCAGSNKQQHTMYFTIRSGESNFQLESPEVAYNYLKNNRASSALHYFDENHTGTNCGNFTTPFKFHDNVVLNQTGPAITNYAKCPIDTTFEYYNNVAINSGFYDARNDLLTNNTKKLTNFEAVFIAQVSGAEASTATLNFYNNTFIKWNDSDRTGVVDSCIGFHSGTGTININWNDNVCLTDKDKPFIQSDYQGTALETRISGGTNAWYTSAGTQTNAIAPTWDATKITTDPLLTVNLAQVTVGEGSPLIGQSSTTLLRDIYGARRAAASNVGAVE